MNKRDLIEAATADLGGDKKTAERAVNSVLDTIMTAVAKGENVTIAGFGTFERRDRAARTARNPQTGEKVRVKKTRVPGFKPSTTFKSYTAAGRMPKAAVKAAATPAKKATAAGTTATKKAAAGTATAKKTATKAATKGTAKKATATKSAAKSVAKKAPAKTTAKKAPAKKTAAKKAPAKKTASKRTAKKS